MLLSVFSSFEPASLERALRHWASMVGLFDAISVAGPSRFEQGLVLPVGSDELRVLLVDNAGAQLAVAGGLAPVLQVDASGPAPVVVRCPDASAGDVEEGPPMRGDWLDARMIAITYGVEEIVDADARAVAAVPYTDAFYLAVATAIVRHAHRRLRPEAKVIAVDCDGTLWQGSCAEDGAEGIVVGPEELALHEALVAQQRAGRIIALVTKNVPADVEAVFARRRDLGLTLSDVAVVRAGWEPKASVLRALSGELGLALDSFVFVDDSRAECAAVAAALPEVAVVHRPASGVADVLAGAWPLDVRSATGGLGAARTALYRGEDARRAVRAQTTSFADFVASLDVRVELSAATLDDADRVFELAQRTNQFNTSSDRPSRGAVHGAIAADRVVVARVADRFGEYGLCGVAFIAGEVGVLRVERLLLSCRVLGRGVEEQLFDGLLALARARRHRELSVRVSVTERNQPARQFFAWLGGRAGADVDGDDHRFPVDGLGPTTSRFGDPWAGGAGVESRRSAWVSPDWNEVAAMTVDQGRLADVLGIARPASVHATNVLEVIGDVLGRRVAAGDNLYALGADSLRLARIVARLRGDLGIDVSFAQVLHRGDVDDLLELARPDSRPSDDDDWFVTQIGSLYDDEPVR